jgi:hypothetical protein
MEVKGHASIRVWQEFKNASGSWSAWNDHHLGEVVQYVNGESVLAGKCKVCGGTSQATCTTCKGTGKAVCPSCQGRKQVLESELKRNPAPAGTTSPAAPTSAPKPQTRFELKDGRVSSAANHRHRQLRHYPHR